MDTAENNYPVLAEHDGIKLKTEKMVPDQLYHCIYDNKVFLFYMDEENLLHCYEVEDPDAVREIAERPSDLDGILKRHAQAD